MKQAIVKNGNFSAMSKPWGCPPKRRYNADVRPREYLTMQEVQRLVSAARRRGRLGFRDALIIRTLYKHALRVSELCALQWHHLDLHSGLIHIDRSKNGSIGVHALLPEELRAFRKLKRLYPGSRFVFNSELGDVMSTRSVHHIVQQAGKEAGFKFLVHPHMLRHGRGFLLVNNGEDIRAIQHYFGHKRLDTTARYTALDHQSVADFGVDW